MPRFLIMLKGTRALAYQNNYKFSIVLYILKVIMALSIIAVTVFYFIVMQCERDYSKSLRNCN